MTKASTLFSQGKGNGHEPVAKSSIATLAETLTEKLGLHEEFPADFHENENGSKGDVESE
jgi:hypothetical protein